MRYPGSEMSELSSSMLSLACGWRTLRAKLPKQICSGVHFVLPSRQIVDKVEPNNVVRPVRNGFCSINIFRRYTNGFWLQFVLTVPQKQLDKNLS